MGRELICADVCADGVGAREWMEMGGEKGLVGMCEGGEGKGNGWKWVGAWVWA